MNRARRAGGSGAEPRTERGEERVFHLPEDVALPEVHEDYGFVVDERLRELYGADAFLRAQHRASRGRALSAEEMYAFQVFRERNERQRAEVWDAIRLRKAQLTA